MKKFFSLLLAALLAFTVAGCSGDPDDARSTGNAPSSAGTDAAGESSAGDGNGQGEAAAGEFETEEIKLIDGLYDEEDVERIHSIQGHITHIDNGGTFPVLLADNKVYSEDYGTLKEIISLPETPDDILYFDSSSIGENLLCFKDGKISLYPAKEYGIGFTGLTFNAETDFVGEIGTSSFFNLVRREDDGYHIAYYEKEDENGTFTLKSQKPLKAVETPDVEALSVKEIIPLRSNSDGYCVYVLTDSNDVYEIGNVNSNGKMTTVSSAPLASNVDTVLAPAETYLTVPIYSKAGDTANLYSAAPGASLTDASDNSEVSFVLPDSHTPSEVSDIFRVSDKLVFVFANGDTYFTDDIEKEDRTSYEMVKLDDVSQFHADGAIRDMAGAEVMDDNLYMLMSDGKLYYRPLE